MPCAVCFEEFNKSTRAPTKCAYCVTELCRTCLQTYLLNDISDQPRCVNPECGHGMEREFLDSCLTRSFRLGAYKEHREKVLSDREKARLPATQEDAAEYKTAQTVFQQSKQAYGELRAQIDMLHIRANREETRMRRANLVVETYGRERLAAGGGANPVQTVRATFVKPCPAAECKGFLSTAWKCGMCEQWTCPDCHELKGANRDTEHTCDPGKVATAQLLAREARGCPKCGVQICKIEGCDQMWCTSCNTGFNWRTGKVAEGPVHNPHYFEWLRSQGRNPTQAQGVANCDHQTDRQVTIALQGGRGEPRGQDDRYLHEVWRLMREEQDPYGRRRDADYEANCRILRVRFMAGEISEEDWKVALQRNEKDAHFQRAKNQVRDLFVNAAGDLIRRVLTPGADKAAIRAEVQALLDYCNASYANVSARFNRKTRSYAVRASGSVISA